MKRTLILLSITISLIFTACKYKNSNFSDIKQTEITDSLIKKCYQFVSQDNEIAKIYLKQIYKKSTEINYINGIAEYFYLSGRILYYEDDYHNSNSKIDSALYYYTILKNPLKISDVYFALSKNYAFLSDFEKSIEFCNKSLNIRNELNNKCGIADCYVFMGEIQKAQGNIKKSYYFFDKAIKIQKEINDFQGLANSYRNLGNTFEITGQNDTAYKYFHKAFEIDQKYGNIRTLAISKHSLGKISTKKNQFDTALTLLNESLSLFAQLDEKYGQSTVMISIAELYFIKNDFQTAKNFYFRAFEIAKKCNILHIQQKITQNLAEIYKNESDIDSAFFYLESYISLYTKIFNEEKEQKIQETEAKFELFSKNQEIELLKQQNKRFKQQKIIIILISALVILFISFSLLFLIMRTKNLRQKNIILKNLKLIEQKEKEILKEKIESQNKELASKSLMLIQNNQSTETLINSLKTIEKYILPEHKPKLKTIIKDLEMSAKSNIWNEFEKTFNSVHNTFFDTLLKICPDLSPVEIKIAALLKLNLSSKEIAAITFKSESSIKTTRHRLRKKLNLSTDNNLTTFLMKL